jgi:hypothetical protein
MSGFVRPPATYRWPLTIPEAGPAWVAGEGALTVNVFATGSNSQVVACTLSIVDVSKPPFR